MNYLQIRKQWYLLVVTVLVITGVSINFSCAKEETPYDLTGKSLEILELKILTKNFEQSRKFWIENLGLELLPPQPPLLPNNFEFTVKVGNSRLHFVKANIAPGMEDITFPQYHFAFNIPSNQIENALSWLQNYGNQFTDGPSTPVKIWVKEGTGAEIIRRDRYNAHSVFFSDPGGNMIELVARHNLNNQQEGNFNKSMFLNISEVAIVTKDVRESAKIIKDNFDVTEVPGTTSGFKPLGGENGLIDLVVPGRPWEPTDSQIATSWPMTITIKHPVPVDVVIPETNFQEILIRTQP